MKEICGRCGESFEIDSGEFIPEKLCDECMQVIEDDPNNKARLRLDGGDALEVSEMEARRMLRFQQLIDAGYMPKEAMAKIKAELGEFEK